jgi:type IV secretion system protein VirB1
MLAVVVTLVSLLQQCAPNAGARTMTAIVRVESGGNTLAIHDNTTGASYEPRTVDAAAAAAQRLVRAGHSVDLGLGQVNSANLAGLHLSVRDAFDPCLNLHAGATILAGDYARAAGEFGSGQHALRRAIGAYNTGSVFSGDGYIDKILLAAGLPVDDGAALPDLQGAAVLVRMQAPAADPNGAPILVGNQTHEARAILVVSAQP